MNLNFLDFEQPIIELEEKVLALRQLENSTETDVKETIQRLESECKGLTRKTFEELSTAQIVKLARHPLRPHAIDLIPQVFTDFDELCGDRQTARGTAIISGTARLDDQPVVVIATEKGRNTKEKVTRNFGMPRPEEYRKALRVMQLAEKFSLPVITLIDTPGAYPGIDAEKRNQSEAIARNLFALSDLKVPVIACVIGEGGSGGALALGVADQVLMMQYAIYSVISPEGCASILWRTADKSSDAAEAMGVDAESLLRLGLIDRIIPEPMGGAHRDYQTTAATIKNTLVGALDSAQAMRLDDLLKLRQKRLCDYGAPTMLEGSSILKK